MSFVLAHSLYETFKMEPRTWTGPLPSSSSGRTILATHYFPTPGFSFFISSSLHRQLRSTRLNGHYSRGSSPFIHMVPRRLQIQCRLLSLCGFLTSHRLTTADVESSPMGAWGSSIPAGLLAAGGGSCYQPWKMAAALRVCPVAAQKKFIWRSCCGSSGYQRPNWSL